MAVLTIVSVRDSAAGLFNRPMYVANANIARRSLQDEVNRADPNNDLYKHPSDFELYELGFFDEATATFELNAQPRSICRAQDLKDAS